VDQHLIPHLIKGPGRQVRQTTARGHLTAEVTPIMAASPTPQPSGNGAPTAPTSTCYPMDDTVSKSQSAALKKKQS
jgi:hypothetical protein